MNKLKIFSVLIIVIALFVGASLYNSKRLNDVGEKRQEPQSQNVIDLSSKNITSLPAEIGEFSNAEILDVSHNSLTGALPAEIRKM